MAEYSSTSAGCLWCTFSKQANGLQNALPNFSLWDETPQIKDLHDTILWRKEMNLLTLHQSIFLKLSAKDSLGQIQQAAKKQQHEEQTIARVPHLPRNLQGAQVCTFAHNNNIDSWHVITPFVYHVANNWCSNT